VFVVGNFIDGVATILNIVLNIYLFIIIARALISWVSPDPYNPVVQILYRLTEPVLAPIRYRMPDMGGIDISPIVVMLAIIFLQSFLVASLHGMARVMR
jgi:YggT family protein